MPASPALPEHRATLAGGVRLAMYLGLSLALMLGDSRGGWLNMARERASIISIPFWWLAALPSRMYEHMRENFTTHTTLTNDNRRLRNELMQLTARQARLAVEAEENARLRGLLGAGERSQLDMHLTPILNAELAPGRQRLMLAAGARSGIHPGSSVIDEGGLLGQVTTVTGNTASVLLITDMDHAVPVLITRSGMRLVAYGSGRSDRLELPDIPLSGDIDIGDALVTSGLGGRFPPGIAVGTVTALHPDTSLTFLTGTVTPAAHPNHGRDVLVLREVIEEATNDNAQAAPVTADGGAP